MYQTPFRLLSVSLALLCVPIGAGLASAQQRTYDMNFTTSPPTIDGVFDAGEWAASAGSETGWTLQRTSASPDASSFGWQGMWGAEGMYLAVTSSQTVWATDPSPREDGRLRFNRDSINLYFDPNQDGEDNVVEQTEVDGYQVAFATLLGSSEYSEGAGTPVFLEAHVNSATGDQGLWGSTNSPVDGLVGTEASMNHGSAGSVVEMFIPWTDFNAEGGDATAEGLTVTGPAVNDTWFFNVGSISTSTPTNSLPVWNNSGHQLFAARQDAATAQYSGNIGGHGEISFVGAIGGDTDLDGDVDVSDIIIVDGQVENNGDAARLLANLGTTTGATWTTGDFNGDGDVDVSQIEIVDGSAVNVGDASILLANLGTTSGAGASASAVPEPASAILLAGLAMPLMFRRRRS